MSPDMQTGVHPSPLTSALRGTPGEISDDCFSGYPGKKDREHYMQEWWHTNKTLMRNDVEFYSKFGLDRRVTTITRVDKGCIDLQQNNRHDSTNKKTARVKQA